MALDEFADDFNDVSPPFGAIGPGGVIIAELQTFGDRDWYRIQLSAGVAYTIDMMGDSTSNGTLTDPLLYLYNASDVQVAVNDDNGETFNNGGLLNIVNHDARIIYTPATTGIYYIEAMAYLDNKAGSYTLTMTAPGVPDLFTEGNDSVALPYTYGLWSALGGDDVVEGTSGVDRIFGDAGNDYLFSNGFSSGVMKSGAGNDLLDGGEGNDGLFAGDGNDILNGGGGSDGMVGGGGTDALNGGIGGDFLFGGFFTTGGALAPGSGNDTLNGGAGNDGLWGQDGVDTINGDGDNDYVEGGAGNDVINGGAGSDYLLGQGDADTINGGTGFDYLYGGLGADTFIFRKGDSADWILDFSAAQGDKLRFLDFGYANFAAIPLVELSTPGNPAVQLTFSGPGGVDQLTIFGVTLAQLNATNVLVA